MVQNNRQTLFVGNGVSGKQFLTRPRRNITEYGEHSDFLESNQSQKNKLGDALTAHQSSGQGALQERCADASCR